MNGEAVLLKRRTWWRNRVAVPLAFAVVLTQLALVPGAIRTAQADTHDVCVDDAAVLRTAIEGAVSGATVEVDPGTYYLTEGPITVATDVSVVGQGGTASDVIIDACRLSRVFDVTGSGSGTARIENLTITGGQTQSGKNGGGIEGGGVQVFVGASLDLIDVHIFDNDATEGGGLYNAGTTRVEGSTIEFNRATRKGGGIETDGTLTLINSTLSTNTGKGGGGLSAAGTALVSFSTIYQNVSTNKIGAGTLRNGGTLSIWNSIVAQNIGSDGDFHDCSGTPDVKNVLVSSAQGCNPEGAYIIDTQLLGPLVDNGGRTTTHALPDGSHPAVDAQGFTTFDSDFECLAVINGGDEVVTVDQRDVGRTGLAGAVSDCDIGAFEWTQPLEITGVSLTSSDDPVEVGAAIVPIDNIQTAIVAAASEGTSTSSTPLSAIPLSAIPLSAIPLSAIPLSAIPLSAIPLSAIPLSAIPLSAIPLSAIPLSAIPLSAIPLSAIQIDSTPLSAIPLSAILLSEVSTSGGESIENYLAGTPIQGTPILALNFEDLVAVPLSAIDMDVSPLSAIPLSAIPLSAIGTEALDDIISCSDVVPQPPNTVDCSDPNLDLGDVADAEAFIGGTIGDVIGMDDINLGATPLSAIPLSAIALGDTPLSAIPLSAISVDDLEATLQEWCDALNSVEPTLCDDLGIDPENGVGGDYTLMALALGGIPLSAIPLSAIPLSAIPLSAIPLSAIPLSAITWASTPLSAIPLSAIPLSAIDVDASPLSAIPLSAIPLSAIDCGLINCADGSLTLGHAADAGAIVAGTTLNDILLAIGGYTVGDLDGIDFGDYTFQDLLYGLLAPSEIPWEEINIETARFPDAADPSQPTFDYYIDFSLESPTPVDMTFTLTPPDGFLFAGGVNPHPDPVRLVQDPAGVAPLESSRPERPTEGAGGVLTLELPGISEGDYRVKIAMRAGVVLGTFDASVDIEADRPSDSLTSGPHSDTDSITVVQASLNEPGGSSELRITPLVVEGDLELAHIASGSDLDLYQFEVDGSLIGQSAKILLSNLPDDYDLVLYGPPLAEPIRNATEQGFDAVEAFVWDLNPEDEVLDTETLEDVPHDPEIVGLSADNALHAVSSRRGTNDEEIDTGTLQAGTYYVQVSSYNGAFSDDPYLLRLRLSGGVLPDCDVAGFTYDGLAPGANVPAFPALPNGLNTLVLYNHERLYTDFATDAGFYLGAAGTGTVGSPAAGTLLAELAEIPSWNPDWGAVAALIPVDAIAPAGGGWDVRGALIDLNFSDASLCDPQAANDVVREIGKLIDYVAASHDIENVVIVGDDSMIPFARIPDKTAISNERTHGVGFAEVNETVGALLAGYYLSDDPFGTQNSIEVNNLELFVPTMAVGRLVEEPGDIAGALSNYRTYQGVLDSSTGAIVTGYDFLEDGTVEVRDNLIDQGFTGITDIDPPVADAWQEINEEWSRADVVNLIANNGWSVLSLNAHFDQTRALPAAGNATGDESDLYTSDDVLDNLGNPLFTNHLIFSMGCHSGLSISDIQIGTPGTGVPDWAQRFGQGGNVLVANTGFGYGDTEKVAYSEAVSAAFALRLGSMTSGQAWVGAKQEIASGNYILDPYTMKAMQEFVFYGLPMLRTQPAKLLADQEAGGGAGGSSITGIAPPAPFNAGQFAEITFFPPIGSGLPQIIDPLTGQQISEVGISLTIGASGPGMLHKETTPEGAYYQVDGQTLQVQGRPIQPRTGLDVTDPDGEGGLASYAAGVLITGLTGRQEPIDPLISSPTVDIGDGTDGGETDFWRPEADDPTFPAGIQRVVTYVDDEGQTRQQWVVVPGRYNGNTGLQELFLEVEGEVYYRDPAVGDFLAPWIRESLGFYGEDIAFFEITVEGEDDPSAYDDVERVYVLFREESVLDPTPWLGVDLFRSDENSNLWVGGRPRESTGTNFEFLVQAVDKNGNVSTAAAKGDYFNIAAPIELGEIEITLTGTQDTDSVWYLGDVTATAESPGNITKYRLDGVEASWDGGDLDPDLIISGNGGHFLEVFDDIGGFAFRFVAIDDTGPEVTSFVTPDPVNNYYGPIGTFVTINADDPFGSGVAKIEWDGDGSFAAPSFAEPLLLPEDPAVLSFTVDVPITETTTLHYRAIDNVGNIGDPGAPQLVQIDSTPPVVTPTTSVPVPASGWFTTGVDLILTAVDLEAGVESVSYSFDWNPLAQTGTWTTVAGDQAVIPLTTSGVVSIWFYATDNVGNEPARIDLDPFDNSEMVQVDIDDPIATVDVVDSAENSLTTSLEYGTADFFASIDCTDPQPGSGVEPPGTCDASVAYPGGSPSVPIADGEAVPTDALGDFTISVIATDVAGNTSSTAQASYTVVDTVAPIPVPGLPADGDEFEFGVDEPVVAFSCDDTGGSPVTCTATVDGEPIFNDDELPVGEEGPYVFVLTATDEAGNTASITITYHVVDTEAPAVVASAPVANSYGWYNATVPVTLTADPGAGTPIASVGYSLDNSNWTDIGVMPNGTPLEPGVCVLNLDGTVTCLVNVDQEGVLTFYSRATDSATYRPPGSLLPPPPNVGTGNQLSLDIDLTDPTILITAPLAGETFSIGQTTDGGGNPLEYIFSCDDPLSNGAQSGIDAAVGCTAVVTGPNGTSAPFDSGTTPIDTSTPGSYTVTVTTADEAGNTHSESVVYNVAFGICYLYDTEKEQPTTGTIVIRLFLCDAEGNNISSRDNVLTAVLLDENPPLPNDQGGSNDGFEFRYRANSNSFIYNLDLSTTGSTGGFPPGPHTLFFVVDSTEVQIVDGVPVAGPNDVLYEAPFATR